jgi:predicted nucleic acid-binding Zn ribbon protein
MGKKGPIPIGNVIADILTRRGLGRPQATIELEKIWSEVVGSAIAPMTRCGKITRQQLNIVVTNSTIMQELTFRKQEIIQELNKKIPDHSIKDIKFRVGSTPNP